ncbi:MAG: hypothetical protein C4531_07935 [Desulfurivibrio sp.]|nr:MAG: hypothetical protein C4531_07935 [Desulfurivibrio sp.]
MLGGGGANWVSVQWIRRFDDRIGGLFLIVLTNRLMRIRADMHRGHSLFCIIDFEHLGQLACNCVK